MDEKTDIDDDDTEDNVLDMASINADIVAGARAFEKLVRHAADDWNSWSITIRGFRALRNLCFAKAQTNNVNSDAYRKQMGALLELKKYSMYSQIKKQDRSDMYRLMDGIEEIDVWYARLDTDDKMRWKHPNSIIKHCPKNMLKDGMRGHNKPPKSGKKKPAFNAEVERLKAILIQVIRRLVKYEPDAVQLLDEVSPTDPNDEIPPL